MLRVKRWAVYLGGFLLFALSFWISAPQRDLSANALAPALQYQPSLLWTRLSSTTGQIVTPSGSTEQTASLVLDIDKDGLNDFVIAARKSPGPSVVWYRRHDSGWDKLLIDSAVLPIEAGGAFYDIDRDGDLDIVFGGDYQSNQMWWWENPYPDYELNTPWTRRLIKNSGGQIHHDQVFGDFDGNGQVELAFWNQLSWAPGQKSLFLAQVPSDPAGSSLWPLTEIGSWSGSATPEGLVNADVDGDNIDDIIGGGSWFKFNGTGYTEEVIDGAKKSSRVAVGQLKSGGRPEVVFVPAETLGRANWYEWDGNQWLARDLLGFDVDSGHSLEIGDVNRDGNLDIFLAEMRLNGGNPDAKSWIFLGDGNGNFAVEQISTGIGNHESRLADLDGDSDLDILGKPYNWDTPRLDIWINESDCVVSLDEWDRHVVDFSRPQRAIFVLPGDLDGDGLKDIVSGDSWYRNPGIASGTWVRSTIGAPLNNVAALYDFDGDGRLDILGTQGVGSATNANFAWARNNGNGSFTIHTNIAAGLGDFLQGVAVDKFTPGGPTEVMLSWHDETKPLQALTVPAAPLTQQWTWREVSPVSEGEQLSAQDIDRDGDIDLLLGAHWLQNNAGDISDWVDPARRFRLPFTVATNGFARQDSPAELDIDFTALLDQLGTSGSFNPNALRVVEVGANSTVLNDSVPFQFDQDSGYDPATNASGKLIILLQGATPASAQRDFHLYFDVIGGPALSAIPVANRVTLTDNVQDAGQASYQIQSNAATYFYHKTGGGFSTLLDSNGNDWINHSDAAGSAGDYRGIPNIVHPNDGGHFHPGRDTVTSSIVNQGPLKATIHSATADNAWETEWEIYPDFARLTVLKAATSYWFLYEGTPGGLLEPAIDFVVRSNGTQSPASESWTGDIGGGEWLYFSDPNVGRSLYFAHHNDDALVDSYYAMEGQMTVFGFGRQGNNRYLTATPQQFTMGFVEDTLIAGASPVINAAFQPLAVTVGAPEGSGTIGASGPWQAHTLHGTSEMPDRNRLADINGDGRLDAIIGYETNNVPGKVAWYEQPGNATAPWTEHIIASVIGPMSLDVGDMDKDGDLDVIVGEHNTASPSTARLLVYENPGSQGGTWEQHILSTGDEHHDGAQLVDIDNDRDLDAISIGWTHNRVLLYENTSTCSSSLPTPQPTPSSTPVPEETPTFTLTPSLTQTPGPTSTGTPLPTATNTPGAGICAPDPNNVLANPGFESGGASWTSYFANGVGTFSTGSPAFECDLSARFTFSGSSNNMQLYQNGFTLLPNTDYVLSFAATSNSGDDLDVFLHKHTSPYTSYGVSATANLTSSWKTFTYPFTTGSDPAVPRLRFWFVGKAGAGDVYQLDDVRIVPAGAAPATPTNTPGATTTPTPLPTPTNTPIPGASVTPTSTATPGQSCNATLTNWQRHVIDPARPGNFSAGSWTVDINHDGWDDLLSGAYWYENPKSGINSTWARHYIGDGFSDVVTYHDFDGDGDYDLLGVSGVNWPLVWAQNDGDGNFVVYTNIEAGLDMPTPDPYQGVAVEHFSPGGPLEVAVTWDDTEDVNEFPEADNPHGIQMFTVPEDPTSGTWSRRKLSDVSQGEELSAADIDNDSDIDLYLGNIWLRNNFPLNQWTPIVTFEPGYAQRHPDRHFVIDMDGDGDLDTIDVYGHDQTGRIAWYEQPDADPFATWIEHIIFESNKWPGFGSMDIADMDGDGDTDFVASEHYWQGDLSQLRTLVFENVDGSGGSWQVHVVYQGDESHLSSRLSDYDHDGDLDILDTGYKHKRVHIYENLSNHECGTPIPVRTPPPTWTPGPPSTPTRTPSPGPTSTPTAPPTSTATPVVGACLPNPNNVLVNPGFESGKASWSSYFANGAGSFSTVSPAYECNLSARFSFSGSSNNMQLYQVGFTLQPNTNYLLSFAATSSSGHDLSVYLQKHTSPYTGYGVSNTVDLSSSWQTFTIPFTTNGNPTVPRLRFWFVGEATAGDVYGLDDVRIVPAGATPLNTATPTPVPTNTHTPLPVITSTPTATTLPTTGTATAVASLTPTPTAVSGVCTPSFATWQRHLIEPDRPIGTQQSQFAFAVDVNRDGWDDLLSGGHWYENPRASIGATWLRHTVGIGFQDVIAYHDFDGDGDFDLLGVAGENWPVIWAENDGSGKFTVHTNIDSNLTMPSGEPVAGLVIGHLHPGAPLEVVISWDGTENPAINPHGLQVFTVPTDPASGTWARRKLTDFSRGEDLSAADIDRDGDLDLYLGNYWLRNEHPTSQWTTFRIHVAARGHADRSFIYDMNSDGDLDVIDSYGADPEGKIAWYEHPDGSTFGTWTQRLVFQSNRNPGFASMAMSDMDNDGDLDIVAGEHTISGSTAGDRTFVLENLDGSGGSWQEHLVHTGDETHQGLAVADFDHDQDMDIMSTGIRHRRIQIYENLSNHNCGTPIPTAAPIPTRTPPPSSTPTRTPDPGATATPSPMPTSTPTAVPTCVADPNNALANPGFESGTSSWTSYFANGSANFSAAAPAYQCNLSARFAFSGSSNNMQLYQTGFALQPNTDYVLSFAATSNTGHDLSVYLQKHTSPYTNFGVSATVNLTSAWQTFTIPFTSGSDASAPRLRFWFVGHASAGDVYWLDDVQLKRR